MAAGLGQALVDQAFFQAVMEIQGRQCGLFLQRCRRLLMRQHRRPICTLSCAPFTRMPPAFTVSALAASITSVWPACHRCAAPNLMCWSGTTTQVVVGLGCGQVLINGWLLSSQAW